MSFAFGFLLGVAVTAVGFYFSTNPEARTEWLGKIKALFKKG